MRLPLGLLRIVGLVRVRMDEHWLARAIEDELERVMTNYRSKGQDIHNVGKLRERVAANINALRGTSEWGKLKLKYDPPLQNRMAWCRVCEKPVNMGSVSAWLEDKGGNIYCSSECKEAAPHVFISLNEWKQRVKEKGSVTGRRKEIVDGEVVDGEEFVLTWDEVENFGGAFTPSVVAAAKSKVDDEILWD